MLFVRGLHGFVSWFTWFCIMVPIAEPWVPWVSKMAGIYGGFHGSAIGTMIQNHVNHDTKPWKP